MPPDLYSQHAEIIEAALSHATRAHRLSRDAGDEFASWARLRLIDNDFAILRKFKGHSLLSTYLTAVVQRLFLDWRNAEWGKWRPTTAARRAGMVAIELERLVLRDQMPFGEAAALLVAKKWAASRAECDEVWASLPRRPRRRFASEELLDNLPAGGSASDDVMADERRAQADDASASMANALAALPSQDQLIIRLRFHDGFTVARIANLVHEDQKALYRRFDRLMAVLRDAMTANGVSPEGIAELLAAPVDLQPVFEGDMGDLKTRPSTTASTGGEHV